MDIQTLIPVLRAALQELGPCVFLRSSVPSAPEPFNAPSFNTKDLLAALAQCETSRSHGFTVILEYPNANTYSGESACDDWRSAVEDVAGQMVANGTVDRGTPLKIVDVIKGRGFCTADDVDLRCTIKAGASSLTAAPAEQAELAARIYAIAQSRTESFEADPVMTSVITYLMGAVLEGDLVDLRPVRYCPAVATLRQWFRMGDPVWEHILID